MQKEKKLLEVKRLDLDAAKSRLRKAKSQTAQQQVSNTIQLSGNFILTGTGCSFSSSLPPPPLPPLPLAVRGVGVCL